MDRRDSMAMSGSASFYLQRGIGGAGQVGGHSGLSVSSSSPGINTLPNTTLPFQSNIGSNTIGSSTSPLETSSPVPSHGGVNVGGGAPPVVPTGESVKRKRGRPRKYGPDGTVSLALSSSLPALPGMITPVTQKRGRGRPRGSGRKQLLASFGAPLSVSAGMGFTPHVITIAVGEDIAMKLLSFSQQGARGICVLSANGSISTVTLRQPSTSGGTVTYEGRFEIVCLSGSYLHTNNDSSQNRTGGLSVSLASPDGRVIGGGVGGMLIAASTVQVIVGSFIWGGSKTKNKKVNEGHEGARELENQTAENAVTAGGIPTSQNLTPSSPVGVWPIDIDLMRS